MEPYVHPIVAGLYAKRREYADAAEVELLEGDRYWNMIKKFAVTYSMSIDDVFKFTSFGTVTKELEVSKREGEYTDRYTEHEKNMNTPLK
jgi:hypothetical protein